MARWPCALHEAAHAPFAESGGRIAGLLERAGQGGDAGVEHSVAHLNHGNRSDQAEGGDSEGKREGDHPTFDWKTLKGEATGLAEAKAKAKHAFDAGLNNFKEVFDDPL